MNQINQSSDQSNHLQPDQRPGKSHETRFTCEIQCPQAYSDSVVLKVPFLID